MKSIPWWSPLVGLVVGWMLREMSESLRGWRKRREDARDHALIEAAEKEEGQRRTLHELRTTLPDLFMRDDSEFELATVNYDPLQRARAWDQWERDLSQQEVHTRDLAEDLEDAALREAVCQYVTAGVRDSARLDDLISRLGEASRREAASVRQRIFL